MARWPDSVTGPYLSRIPTSFHRGHHRLTDDIRPVDRLLKQHDVVLAALELGFALGRRVQDDRAPMVDFGDLRGRVCCEDRESAEVIILGLAAFPYGVEAAHRSEPCSNQVAAHTIPLELAYLGVFACFPCCRGSVSFLVLHGVRHVVAIKTEQHTR